MASSPLAASALRIVLLIALLACDAASGLLLVRPAACNPRIVLHSSSSQDEEESASSVPLTIHHAAIKTRNITTSIQFYSLLGYRVACQFRAGPAKAVWLELDGAGGARRLEVIEVPSYMLNEAPGTRRRAVDLMQRQDVLGYNHLALDVTHQIQELGQENLSDWMDTLNNRSLETFGKALRIALEPRQQIIGSSVYELAFLYDADGCLVELLHFQNTLEQNLDSGWDPWDGTGFSGSDDKSQPAL